MNFFFTDENGVNFGQDDFDLEANSQIAKFLDEAPFNGVLPITGTLTFSSTAPVSVIALRGFTNERSEFLMTTMPVSDLQITSTDPVVLCSLRRWWGMDDRADPGQSLGRDN